MTSKIGRFIPLSISAVTFIWFLINFNYYKFDVSQHFNYGAGWIWDIYGAMFGAPLIANLYLHPSLMLLFASGILLFIFYNRFTTRSYLVFSISMFIMYLMRPVISTTVTYFQPNGIVPFEYLMIPTFRGQLIGRIGFEFQFDRLGLVQSLLGGIVLLLLLLINLILAFRHKQDLGYVERKQQQRELLHQQTQARQSAFVAQQQMQAQAFRQMPVPVQQQGIPTSMTQELERLQQMYNSGALTEEEFTVAKKRVLGN
jgi:hypothetical protein